VTVFYFVRHGLTGHTGHKLTGWHPGVALTERGRAQAEAAAVRLAPAGIKALYASPIDRTRQTAEAIAAKTRLSVVTRDGLGEVHYGKWSNRSFKSLMRTRLWEQVHRWPSAARFPDGENLRETQARALAEVEILRETHRKDRICCVTHADVIKLVIAHYLGVHIDLFQRIAIDPGSISIVTLGERGPLVNTVNLVPEIAT